MNVIVKGHAYRPTRNPYGRNVIPGCECGEHIAWAGAVNTTTARYIHREHKRAILRDPKRQP